MSFNLEETALRYLSSRSRTTWEMQKHLAEKGFEEEEIKALLENFRQCGYLDDSRYCTEYFRYAFGKGKGKRKVFYELREKGIEPSVAEIAFEDFQAEEETPYDEFSQAKEEAEKVVRMADIAEDEPVPEKILARAARKLQSKGYGSDTIYRVLGDLRRRSGR